MKFCISKSFTDANGGTWNQNNSFCYTCPLTAEGNKQNVKAGAQQGVRPPLRRRQSDTRNSYLGVPAGSNFIVFDLRHNTFLHPKNNY